MARRPLLTQAQLDYLLRAERIKAKLSRKALAAKWGVSVSTLHHYVGGDRSTLEQWQARRLHPSPRTVERRGYADRTKARSTSTHGVV